MITEDYISFEVAKLLKDKKFDQNCATYYLDKHIYRHYHGEVIPKYKQIYAAPTQAIAMKWLRIEHNIHIEPHIVRTKRSYGYMPNYINLKELKQHFPFDEFDFNNADEYVCITYDKACEITIKYCLENLI